MAEIVLAIICGVVVLVFAWRSHDRYQARRLVRLRALADDFYPRLTAVFDDPDLTEPLLRFAMVMAKSIAEPKIYAPLWARAMLTVPKNAPPSSADLQGNMFLQGGDVGAACIGLTTSGLMFMAAVEPIPGLVIRREIASVKRKLARDPAKGKKVVERWVAIEKRLEAA